MLMCLLLWWRSLMEICQDVGSKYKLTCCATLQDQPQAEEAAQTSGPDVDTEASSNGGQLTNVSEASHQGDQDSSISLDQGPHVPAGGMQHGGSGGSKYANSKALLQAARLGRSQDVERLLDAGCTVDIQDADGFTPIYHAARGNLLIILNEVCSSCMPRRCIMSLKNVL